MFAVDKPAGLSMHKTHSADPHETLADTLIAERPSLKNVGEDPLRPGIVHRLDKDTSGVVVVAKDQEAFADLKRQFQERTARKEYLALVHGAPKQPMGTIDLPLGKVGTRQTTQLKGKRELTVRDALTDYRTERNYNDYTLLRVTPKTGRTHQIRVHLKAIGCPIVGDTEYGLKKGPVPTGLDRMFLHAERLELTSPTGLRVALEAPLPAPLQKVLSALK